MIINKIYPVLKAMQLNIGNFITKHYHYLEAI